MSRKPQDGRIDKPSESLGDELLVFLHVGSIFGCNLNGALAVEYLLGESEVLLET